MLDKFDDSTLVKLDLRFYDKRGKEYNKETLESALNEMFHNLESKGSVYTVSYSYV